jgi:hypothetical protein
MEALLYVASIHDGCSIMCQCFEGTPSVRRLFTAPWRAHHRLRTDTALRMYMESTSNLNLMILTAPGNDTRMYRTIDSSAEKKLPSVFKMPAGPLGILLRRRTAGFLA